MITHLEPDILECEVKSGLENITMNKASGSDGFPFELFQILKDDLPSLVGAQYATRYPLRINSRKNEDTEPKQKQNKTKQNKKNTQLWM